MGWNFWTGLDVNDTWSIAYEFRQKYPIGSNTALLMLLAVGFISLILLLWKIKRKNSKA